MGSPRIAVSRSSSTHRAQPGLEDAHLVLLGFGPLRDELIARAAEPASGGRIHVLPAVPPDELPDWVVSADVGVMPNQPRTLNERLSTPNKLFESLAVGLPVVSSDFPERRRIVIDDPDGPLGAVCDPTDPVALGAAIRSILDLDPAARPISGPAASGRPTSAGTGRPNRPGSSVCTRSWPRRSRPGRSKQGAGV